MEKKKILSDKINVQLIAEVFLAMGIKDIIFSPGSRNGALMLHFVNHGGFNTFSIVDERCAAFVAMGMAQKTRKPVVICCTSGSAAANYYPAVTEAFYQNVPIIVLTADRPANYTDIFDGQTIRQKNLYQQHVYYSAQLCESSGEEAVTENFLKVKKAVKECVVNEGPVHINMPFSEPLYGTTTEKMIQIEKITQPFIESETIDWDELQPQINTKKKIFILIGLQHPSLWLNDALDKLAKLPQVIIFTENTSNVTNKDFISRIDNVLFGIEDSLNPELQPDLLITLGQNVISKKVKNFLRKNRPREHWHVHPHWHPDTYFALTKEIKQKEEVFAEELSRRIRPNAFNYKDLWLNLREKNERKQQTYVNEIPFSDLSVFKKIIENYPEQAVIHYSNSSAIRYSQLFPHKKSHKIYCNRGTSGIDGSTSTAVGYAMQTEELVILVTGDISFFYDSNALWNQKFPKNLRIILVNNGGGDIFSIIPGPNDSGILAEYFNTKHTLTAAPLAKLYGIDYQKVSTEKDLENALTLFYNESNNAKILEIDTHLSPNAEVMRAYVKRPEAE